MHKKRKIILLKFYIYDTFRNFEEILDSMEQFKIRKSTLFSHLGTMKKMIETKPVVPVLVNYNITVSESYLKVIASDSQMMLSVDIPLYSQYKGQEINFMVDAVKLTSCIKVLPEEVLDFDINGEILTCHWSDGYAAIAIDRNTSDWPEYASYSSNFVCSQKVKYGELVSALKNAMHAVDVDNLNPLFTGLAIYLNQRETLVVATDAHVLVCNRINMEPEGSECQFILPYKPAKEMIDLSLASDLDVVIDYYVRYVQFSIGSYTLVSRLIDGNFPSYKSVIPSSKPIGIELECSKFLENIKRISVCGEVVDGSLSIQVENRSMELEGRGLDLISHAVIRLSCDYEGNPFKVGFRTKYLLELLENFPEERMEMCFTSSSKAVVFCPKGEDYGYIQSVIMPVTLE